ncbi:serine hydrolase domain-containing protein [Nocardia sp. NPDC059240]|uniref:serine hydrolase domain-containing protein n=1 Tax=Nocardia sp. NPDC059240 TaxID=3346786 RepID=UPI0036750002
MVLKIKASPDTIGGDVDEGYGKVADVFRRNLTGGQEVGAAIAVYRDGKKIVDLWGGYQDGRKKLPWKRDTVVPVFSTTKGISSLTIAVAASRGLIDYDAKVADYWPEFAQAGKASITVRQLLSHQAGLAAIDLPLTLDDVANPDAMSAKIAAQVPAWIPGDNHGYHAVTLGWYETELLRHADPAGRTLGQYFAQEIAKPLGLDFYIGLPDSVDRSRVAQLHCWSRAEMLLNMNAMPPRLVVALLNPRSLSTRAIAAPGVKFLEEYNSEELRVMEMPAANGIGTARAIAKLYGSAAATGDTDLGLNSKVVDALSTPAVAPANGLRDKVLHVDTMFSLGFMKPFPKFVFGSSQRAFGTPGAGGSFGFADPDTGIGFAYVMNRMGFNIWNDPRELALRDALFHDVLGVRTQS